ncbi:MAG TPA: hypothetical protein VGL42_06915 [Opitutaceae bacterium]|jgi:hypothetical protein
MKRILCLLACLFAVAAAQAGNYQNFDVAVYIQVRDVNRFSNPQVLQSEWDAISSQVKVDKVYIEVHRDGILADDAQLDQVKAFFTQRGVKVAAGSAFTANERDSFRTYCYTNAQDRDFVKKVAELAARHFDEFILDDFFFVNTKTDSDIAAKGNRSWTDFRLALMDEAGANLIIKPAKAVNPNIKVVIKYPNWYEHFQGLGFDLDKGPKQFDGIYTGTETRDPVFTDQYLQQYESYQVIRYYDNIKPGGNGGGWVDPYGTRYADRYAEQLWDTMLAKAPEITLFSWSNILMRSQSGDRNGWQFMPTSLNYLGLDYGSATAPTWATVAGTALRQIDGVVGKLGNPIGIASYKPYQSTGEDFLHNFLGMIGIPIDLKPEYPADAKVILLTEAAKFDPDIVAKIKHSLTDGRSVVITSGLLRALQDRGIQDICETSVSENKFTAKAYTAGFGSADRDDLAVDAGSPGILFPEVRFLTNDAWALVSGQENGLGYPVLLSDKYSQGTLYVWTIPDDFRNLYALPTGVTTAIKDAVMKDFPVRIDGASQVSLFAYDNGAFVIESYLGKQTTMHVTVDGTFSKLRNLATGEVIPAYTPPQSNMPFFRQRQAGPAKSHFQVTVLPHSYLAFAPEK